ncbi:MAG: hypothetical protein OXF26_13745 [Alphaproteobacteria bacterium]|nr:hypothetical protein [Alphaproteobacteria bacterium]MCY4317744.1 hypothetical protein [Alphaproteobacteria bacterium]
MADAVIEALAAVDYRERHRFINAGMERDAKILALAPWHDFLEELENPPAWFSELDAALPARHDCCWIPR